MRTLFSGAAAVAVALALAGCDRKPEPQQPAAEAKLTAPENTPTRTSGTAAPETAATNPEPANLEPANPEPANRTRGTDGTNGTRGTSGSAFREVTIPAGTVLAVRLNTPVASDTSRVEQRVDGTLARDVRVGGVEVLDAGSALRGIVTNAERSGRVKGRANVAFKFDQISAGGTVYPISTRTISRVAPGTKKRDAATIGIPAAGGAIIGGIVGGGDGAVKGGAIGGAAGTAAVLSTRGKEVRLAPGTVVSVRLAAPLTVRVAR